MTSEAASAPLMKNSATSTITTNDVRLESGNCSSVVNSADLRRLGDGGGDVGAAELEVDRRAAEDGEPDEGHAGRDREHAEDELADVRPGRCGR